MISEKYNTMSNSGKKIAEFFLQSESDVQTLTISELADICGVSMPTITRFVHSLGFKNFMEFRVEMSISKSQLAADHGTESDSHSKAPLDTDGDIPLKCKKICSVCVSALHQTRAKIDSAAFRQAAEMLWRAKSVYCFGQGNSSSVAMDAWSRFVPVTTKFHWVADAHQQAYISTLLAEDEVILYYSFSGSTRELIESAKLAKRSPGKLILVTHFPNSEGAQLASLVLICGANESPKNQGSIAARVGQILITEILFNEYCEFDRALIDNNRTKTLPAIQPNPCDKPSACLGDSDA